MTKRLTFSTFTAWLSLSLFFLYVYVLRVSSGMMFVQLRSEFCMTAGQFGIFGACYFYAYALAQVPMGVLLDRLGIRWVVLFSLILTLMSTIIFAYADTLWLVYGSRALLGLGSAAVLMSCLKYVSDTMPEKYLGTFMGLSLGVGVMGALGAGSNIPDFLELYSWRSVLMMVAYGGIPLFALLMIVIPAKKSPHGGTPTEPFNLRAIISVVWAVITHRHIMLYGFLSIGVYTPLAVLADLWGPAYFTIKFDWTADQAAKAATRMYAGLMLGSIVLPWISRILHDYNRVIQFSTFGIFFLMISILYIPNISAITFAAGLVGIGILCGAEMLCFTGATHYTTGKTSGTTIGIVNTFNMLGGAILSQLIGKILDCSWGGGMIGNIRVYTVADYTTALVVIICAVAGCAVGTFFLQKPGAPGADCVR
ncbi:MAG: MFS transporter [Alphaproteobacteria bacterium]|nr:MAG: MFS transporter [Alphaproteobacteria bacterium]